MPMKIANPDGDGEIEVLTPDEVKAQVEAKDVEINATKADLDKANATIVENQKFMAEQSGNFKKLREMTDEEKGKLSVEQVEQRKIAEKALEEAESTKKLLADRDLADAQAKRDALTTKYTGTDTDLKKKFDDKFNELSSITDVEKRAEAAATLIGIHTGGANPLNYNFNGAPPPMPKDNDKEQFLSSDKAKGAEAAMGGVGPTKA